MGRVALAFAYDGTAFDSYARQPGHRTVEGELVELLRRERILPPRDSARFQSGSRTDRGVSAAWNVVAFDAEAPPGRVVAAGTRAPPGLVLLSAANVADVFNPRHARRRTYVYLVPSTWEFQWRKVRDLSKAFMGEHDFSNFSRSEPHRDPVRRIDRIRYLQSPGPPRLEFTGPSFAWQQVRRVVAALLRVSEGRTSPAAVRRALADPKTRLDLGVAPPKNLVLTRVEYDDTAFPAPPRAARARLEEMVEGSMRSSFVYGAALEMTPTLRR